MKIYDIDDKVILDAPVTKDAVHEQELSKSDYVRLSWVSDAKQILPVGTYIVPFADGLRYRLLEPYTPNQNNEREWKYQPEFQHPLMWLSKIPFIYTTVDSSKNLSYTSQDWPYLGLTTSLLQVVVDQINSLFGFTKDDDKFTYEIIGEVSTTVNCTFSATSILSALSTIANAASTDNNVEWHLSWEHRCLYFGQISINLGEEIPTLKVGTNIGKVSVTDTKDGYYNVFFPQGSTRNISTRLTNGHYLASSLRLGLNFPSGISYTNAFATISSVENNKKGEDFFRIKLNLKYMQTYFKKPLSKYGSDIYVVRLRIDNCAVNARVEGYGATSDSDIEIYSEYIEYATDPDDNADKENFYAFQDKIAVDAKVYFDDGVNIYNLPEANKETVSEKFDLQYPDGTIDIRTNKNEPKQVLALMFDDVYPHVNCYVYNVRSRTSILKKSNSTEDALDKDGNPIKYSIWYFRLAYPLSTGGEGRLLNEDGTPYTTVLNGVTYYWYDYYINKNRDIIDGYKTSLQFTANAHKGAYPQPLLGQPSATEGFEVECHQSATTVKLDDGTTVKKGDYEIVYTEQNDLIIPTTVSDGLYPRGDKMPNFLANEAIVYNVVMGANEIKAAQDELILKTKKEIERRKQDLNNYSFSSYPNVFEDSSQNPNLYVGKAVVFDDGAGNKLSTRVIKLTTKLDHAFEQSITVGNQKIKGTKTQLKEDVQTIMSGNWNGGGGLNTTQVKSLIRTIGKSEFLSKLTADEAAGRITFDRGIVSKEDVTAGTVIADGAHSKVYGDNAGYRLWLTDGASNLELDNLTVRGKWVAHVLEVMRLQYSEGNRLLGCAGSTIQSVEAYSADGTKIEKGDTSTPVAFYRCYFPATDGTDHIGQPWHKGDYARCQTFNLTDGTYVDATNRIYMRLVTDVSSSPVKPDGTGNECHWVDLSNERNILLSDDTLSPHVDNKPCMGYLYLTDKESGRITDINDIPASGDHIAQVGNAIDTSRQGAIQLIVNGDNPAICVYGGINRPSQSLDEFLYHKISPVQTIINSQQIVLTTGMHQSYPYVDCGDWTDGTTAYQTEVYRYGGSTWVCLKNDTTSAPNSEDGCWAVFAEKGRDAASKRYMLIPNIGSIRRNKFGIASAPRNTVTTKLVYYGGRLIAIDEQHTKMLADRQTPKADDADFYAKGYMFVDNIETKDTTATVQIEQRDTLGNTLAVVTGADEASLQFADIDAKADSLEVTYLTDGQPCAARTVPIIYDGTDGEDGQDGEEYTVQPAQIIITERLNGTLLDDDAQVKSRLEYIYDLPQTFRIMHNHGGESESVEYDRFARGKGSALLGQTLPERVGDYYRISDGHGISTRALQANTDIRQMTYRFYVDGHQIILPIYINRIGTMVSRTVGDTTETLRKRTYTWADEEGTAHTGTLESFVSDASDIFSRTMKKVVEGQTETQSNINQTAEKISASVTSLKDGISKTGIDIDAHTITAKGEAFRWLNPDGTPLVEFNSNITEKPGATFHGHMDATTISTSSGQFTVDEAGNMTAFNMTAFNCNLHSGTIGKIKITDDGNEPGLSTTADGWKMKIGSNGTAYWGWHDESIGFGYTKITNRGKLTTTEPVSALAGINMNCQFVTDTQNPKIMPGTVFVGITDLTKDTMVTIQTRRFYNAEGHNLSWPIGQQLQIVNTTACLITLVCEGDAGTGYFWPSIHDPVRDKENVREFGKYMRIKKWDTAIIMWDGKRWYKTAEYIG